MTTATPATPATLHVFNAQTDREPIVRALQTFIAKRANIQRANYSTSKAYWKDGRDVARDKQDAERLIGYLARTQIKASDLLEATRRAGAGRLKLHYEGGEFKVEYRPSHYFPTEYRKAVCAIVASAIRAYEHERVGDGYIQALKDELGAPVVKRWFV